MIILKINSKKLDRTFTRQIFKGICFDDFQKF